MMNEGIFVVLEVDPGPCGHGTGDAGLVMVLFGDRLGAAPAAIGPDSGSLA